MVNIDSKINNTAKIISVFIALIVLSSFYAQRVHAEFGHTRLEDMNSYDGSLPFTSYAFSMDYQLKAIGQDNIDSSSDICSCDQFPHHLYDIWLYSFDSEKNKHIGTLAVKEAYVFSDGEKFYVLTLDEEDVFDSSDNMYCMYVVVPETEKIVLLDILTHKADESLTIHDVVNDGNRFYFLNSYSIYSYNAETLELKTLYKTKENEVIENSFQRTHVQFHEDHLFFKLWNAGICALDTRTGKVSNNIITSIADYRGNASSLNASRNAYWILNGNVYYRNKQEIGETYAKNLTENTFSVFFPGHVTLFFADGNGFYVDLDDYGMCHYYYEPQKKTLTMIPVEEFNLEKVMRDWILNNR